MNSSFDTRLKRGLFPEMPQSFADGLLRAAETAGGTQNRSAQTDAAKSSATGSEPKKRRFPVGKVLAGALAAVLVAACVVIAVFAPGIGRSSHGATDPVVDPLLGKWTLTRVETIVESTTLFGVETVKWGDVTDQIDYESYLEFTADGYVYLTMYFPEMGEALHDSATYTLSGDSIITEWSPVTEPGAEKDVTLSYDAESDTICMESNGKRREYFSRTPNAQIPAGERKEITELRKQYPEYFGLDTSKGLKVYVWQMAESGYSCALLSGTDERSEIEIGMMKGVTIEQMRLIYSTYDAVKNDIDVEVVPFHNPISSYWYEIDKAYTARVKWLLLGTPIEDGGDLLHEEPIDTAVYDVDGDGRLETCMLTYGPTSGLFTVVFSVYRNGTLAYRNTFNMANGELYLYRASDGLVLERVSPGHDNVPLDAATYRITIENGVIVLTDGSTGEAVDYWGTADTTWNMAVAKQKTPEDMLEGLWCAMNAEEGADGLMDIVFYREGDAHLASFRESGILYDGYTYTVEKQRKTERWDTDDAYAYTFTNQNGHVRKLILCGKDVLDFDMTEWKDDTEEHKYCTYLKLTPIEAEELPYQQQAYIGAGEGYISYLDLVDLTGDGEPERVSFNGYTPHDWVEMKEGESTLTAQLGREVFKLNEKLVLGSIIYIDLDPTNEWVNVLFSTETQDGKRKTYELHLEKEEPALGQRMNSFKLVCGQVTDGYCFLADSPQEELTLGVPTDLFGAKYGYREVKGEALEPVDEWLQASALIERIMFGKREDNIKDGMLLHLVRALPCEIDGKPATLEPDVYMNLREWHESMDRIVFLTEDDRWITVYPDAGLMLNGVSLYEYFDNAPQG